MSLLDDALSQQIETLFDVQGYEAGFYFWTSSNVEISGETRAILAPTSTIYNVKGVEVDLSGRYHFLLEPTSELVTALQKYYTEGLKGQLRELRLTVFLNDTYEDYKEYLLENVEKWRSEGALSNNVIKAYFKERSFYV